MSDPDTYDVVVIGGGPAGENAADHAIRGSSRTAAVVESELLGGECSYWACMPSKALLRPIDVAETAANLGGLSLPTLDRRGLLARRDAWVSDYSDAGQVEWATGAGITVVRGHGRLAGERVVEVTGRDGEVRRLRARLAVVLATGSTPVVPAALADIAPWTNREATSVTVVPDRLAIIGGGAVACEAARWMDALGSEVTVLARSRLLSRLEEFAGEYVADGLRAAGVRVRLGVEVESAERAPDGTVTLHLDDGSTLEVDQVMVATGRRPRTEGLGLEAIGVETLEGSLPDWLYAVGDVTGEAPLTHWGKYRARMVGRRIAALATGRPAPEEPSAPVPQVVFTCPQVAAVGPTARQAEKSGHRVRVLDADYAGTAGAGLLRDDVAGQVRLVVDDDTEVLLGATFVGHEVAEMLHAATVAVAGGLDLATLRRAVPSYPTASEVWLQLLEP